MTPHFFFKRIRALRWDRSQADEEGALISRRLKELLGASQVKPIETPFPESQSEQENKPANRDKFGT